MQPVEAWRAEFWIASIFWIIYGEALGNQLGVNIHEKVSGVNNRDFLSIILHKFNLYKYED